MRRVCGSIRIGAVAAFGILTGCVPAPPVDSPNRAAFYDGVETRLLDEDLVNVRVQMTGMATRADLNDYARCAAAQYTLIRGYGFARHVRTNVQEEGGVWRADAVYTISSALPRGLQTIDAEVATAACAEQGIPTV